MASVIKTGTKQTEESAEGHVKGNPAVKHSISQGIRTAAKVVNAPNTVAKIGSTTVKVAKTGRKAIIAVGKPVVEGVKESLEEEGIIQTSSIEKKKGINTKVKPKGEITKKSAKAKPPSQVKPNILSKTSKALNKFAEGVRRAEDVASGDVEEMAKDIRRDAAKAGWKATKYVGKEIKTKVVDKTKTGQKMNRAVAKGKDSVRKIGAKAGRAAKKAVKETSKAFVKVLIEVGKQIVAFLASLSIPVLLCLLGAVVLLCVFSFMGSDEDVSDYSGVFDYAAELQDVKLETYKTTEALTGLNKNLKPTKSDFPGISDEEFERVMADEYKPDEMIQVSYPQRNFQALLALIHYSNKSDDEQSKDIDIPTAKLIAEYLIDHDAWEDYEVFVSEEEYEITWTTEKTTGKGKDKKTTSEEHKKKMTRTINNLFINEKGIDTLTACIIQGLGAGDTLSNGVPLSHYFDKENLESKEMQELLAFASTNEIFMNRFDEKYYSSLNFPTTGGGEMLSTGKYSGTVVELSKNNVYANNPSLIGQCTWFSYGRYQQTHPSKLLPSSVSGNAAQMYAQAAAAGVQVGQSPRPHSILVFAGTTMYGNTGHVAFVESIETDSSGNIKTIQISQGNVSCPSQAALLANPMAYTQVGTYASLEEYMKTWVVGMRYVGAIY